MTAPTLRVDRIPHGDGRFELAKRWEYDVFGVQNRFTTAADDAAGEMRQYLRWERGSEFYVGFDPSAHDGAPIAVLRALRHRPELGMDSFSTVADARRFPHGGAVHDMLHQHWRDFLDTADPGAFAELATQAVGKRHRRSGVMAQVWDAFFAALRADGVRYVTVALVVPLFDFYRMLLGDALVQIGEMLPEYVGADSIPAILDLAALTTAVQADPLTPIPAEA